MPRNRQTSAEIHVPRSSRHLDEWLRGEFMSRDAVSQKPVEIFIDGTSVGLLYLDHLVEGAVVVEEKALSHLLTGEEIAQVITYLAATGLKVGLLLNFGRRRLEHCRILPPRKFDEWQQRIRRHLWVPKSIGGLPKDRG